MAMVSARINKRRPNLLNRATPAANRPVYNTIETVLDGSNIGFSGMEPCPSNTDNNSDSERLDGLFDDDSGAANSTAEDSGVPDWSQFSAPGDSANAAPATTLSGYDPSWAFASSSPAQSLPLGQGTSSTAMSQDDFSIPFLPSGAVNPQFGLQSYLPQQRAVGARPDVGMNSTPPSQSTRGRAKGFQGHQSLPNNPSDGGQESVFPNPELKRKSVSAVAFDSGISNFTTSAPGSNPSRTKSSGSTQLDTQSSQTVSPTRKSQRATKPSPIPALNSNPLTTPSAASSSSLTPQTGSSASRTSSYQTTDTLPIGISQSPDGNSEARLGSQTPVSKRDHHLARNRLAASKCRQRKKDWVARLEQQYRDLSAQKVALSETVMLLRAERLQLKQQCLEHQECACEEIRTYLKKMLDKQLSVAGLGMDDRDSGPGLRTRAGAAPAAPARPAMMLGSRPIASVDAQGAEMAAGGNAGVDGTTLQFPSAGHAVQKVEPLHPGQGTNEEEMEALLLAEMGK